MLLSMYAPEAVAEERVRRYWSAPGVDMERDARVVVEDGEIAGFGGLEYFDAERAWLTLEGESAGELIEWALATARGRLLSGCWQQNEIARAALEQHDFTLVRHSYRMALELDASVPAAEWPEGVGVRTFRPEDARAVYETQMETFEDSWEHVHQPYEEWAHWTLERPGFDPELWLLATAGDQVAGIALCRVHGTDPETGWVSILGVRRPWRRQGLGRALLLESFQRIAASGCKRAVLGVDASSLTGANRLYENAGMRVIATFDVYERES